MTQLQLPMQQPELAGVTVREPKISWGESGLVGESPGLVGQNQSQNSLGKVLTSSCLIHLSKYSLSQVLMSSQTLD